MKHITTIIILLTSSLAFGQIPGFKKTKLEKAVIDGYRLAIGDTLQLGAGSGVNSEFVFIGTFAGKGLTGYASTTSSAQYANSSMIISYFAKIKGADQLIPVCKPTMGSQQIWLYPQVKNAILKEEIIYK